MQWLELNRYQGMAAYQFEKIGEYNLLRLVLKTNGKVTFFDLESWLFASYWLEKKNGSVCCRRLL